MIKSGLNEIKAIDIKSFQEMTKGAKFHTNGFKGISICPCGYKVTDSKSKGEMGSKTEFLRMRLHEKKCPQATKNTEYGATFALKPGQKVFAVNEDKPETMERLI